MRLIICITVVLCLFLPSHAFAHILKTDERVGAILHLDPDDSPVAGQLTTIYLNFKKKGGSFSLNDCQCQLLIKKDDQTISTQPLLPVDTKTQAAAVFSYTFPDPAVYQLVVRGQDFQLSYDVRVTKGSFQSIVNLTLLAKIVLGAIVGLIAYLLVRRWKGAR